MINSDLFRTGTKEIEDVEVPDVIAELTDTQFQLRGYPESDVEKLILIIMSREVERRTYRDGDGKIRVSFQKLSRMQDERGTSSVYQKLTRTDADVHLYGIPDKLPGREYTDAVCHTGYTQEFRDSWFVVHTPEDDGRYGALMAVETDPRNWEGFWTFQPEKVREINRMIEKKM